MRVLRTSRGKQAVTEMTAAMLLERKRTLADIGFGWLFYYLFGFTASALFSLLLFEGV
jgi:hypothetical protein